MMSADTAHSILIALWNGYVVVLHATVFLAGTWLLLPVARRYGPRLRAQIHAAGLIGMLAVTAFGWLPLGWWAWILPGALTEPLVRIGAVLVTNRAGASSGLMWPLVAIALLYVAGVVFMVARLIIGCLLMLRASRRAVPATDATWQRLLREACHDMDISVYPVTVCFSSSVATALTWGAMKPVLLLPDDAEHWPLEHRRLVLLHELAHVRRGDWLVRVVAHCALAVYWFHPGAWKALQALQAAQEEACDALVLGTGVRGSRYATCLLRASDWARARARGTLGGIALGMASSPIKGRIRQILNAPTCAPASSAFKARLVVACVAWVLFAGSIRLAPQRDVMWRVLESSDWTRRAYAASFLSQTRNAETHARLRESTRNETHALVRRFARSDATPQ